ncbi:hypothetical protein C7H19_13625 [Aphanothece hegewaldii CCALA 016]|uniref:Glycosyltransferase subfamily 4-like N-terminal domain-containing protein n=1 Tax=Aphanothece hegewaldii CCALA 016 TaxID=2107694 RepID=A0A2T1LWG6_9CHRO|nr:glycosyltransferase family 4 protein [Aphanothece hegewaldii]PSF36242.1 hypothetical protein C7H19_13625 [Aphanothece hegewaldii CCALA 016]
MTYGLPYPPNSGVRIHDFNLIKNISQYHHVFLLSLLEFQEEVQYLSQLKQYCHTIDYVFAKPRSLRETIREALKAILTKRPIASYPFYYDEMASKLNEVLRNHHIDIIQIEHSFLAPYIDVIYPKNTLRKILSFHNVGYQQYRTMIKLNSNLKEKLLYQIKWLLMLNWEAKYAQKFDHCLVVSSLERQLLPSKLAISVIENGIDTQSYPFLDDANNNTMIFVGTMGYAPNVDAILYFCAQIFPDIQQQLSNTKLFIVGNHPKPEICQLASSKNIIVTGAVPDIIPYYQQSQVSIVPLRAGGGTRLKILEAMALGKAVVSTSLGCEGLQVIHKKHIMIADTPLEFVRHTIELLTNKELREKIAKNARQLVEVQYDWSKISQKLMTVDENLLKH